jgi:hypothetical protein
MELNRLPSGREGNSRMPDHTPATREDLQELARSIARDNEQLRNQLVEQMRDMQTEVLRAFHNWARPTDIKLRSHEERLALLEERVQSLERGEFPRSQ